MTCRLQYIQSIFQNHCELYQAKEIETLAILSGLEINASKAEWLKGRNLAEQKPKIQLYGVVKFS